MNYRKVINVLSVLLIGFSAFSILMVSLMAFKDPQAVMDLVQVKLPNTDAYSSIRGVYGGVGFTICFIFVWLAIKNPKQGLGLIAIFWGMYAISRLTTMAIEGPLGAFGSKWLNIESFFSILALVTYVLKVKADSAPERGNVARVS